MRAFLLVATLLVGGTLLRADENAPWIKPPAPGVATPHLALHRAAVRQAWLERVVGQPFDERAQGQPWEAEGKAFVAAAFARWQPRSVYENDAELAQRGWRLRYLLQCEDPLVRCLLGRLEMRASPDGFWHWEGYADSMGLYRTGLISGADRIGRALDDLARAGTPRGFLASVGLEAARAWMLVNDAGRQTVWKQRAEGWLRESLTDGSYALPGPDEELLMEDVLGPRGASTGAWSGDLRTAVEKAPLSEWSRLALRASFARDDADLHRTPGGGFDFSVVWANLAVSWKLHPGEWKRVQPASWPGHDARPTRGLGPAAPSHAALTGGAVAVGKMVCHSLARVGRFAPETRPIPVSKLIYIETTIPSFYFETRAKPEIVAMRNWTRDWWQQAGQRDQFVTADAVLSELDFTPEPKRTECLELMAPLSLLEDSPDIDETVEFYIQHKLMPASLLGDARHLALGAWHHCDILATWNCRHIANPNKLEHLHHIHDMLGLHTPILATPYQLLEAEK